MDQIHKTRVVANGIEEGVHFEDLQNAGMFPICTIKPGKCLVALPETEISIHEGLSWNIVSPLPPLQFINQAKSFRATPALRICADQRADNGGTPAGETTRLAAARKACGTSP